MGYAQKIVVINEEEYLFAEEESPIRHEYVNGQVYAMDGASDTHNLITVNATSLLTTRCSSFFVFFLHPIQA